MYNKLLLSYALILLFIILAFLGYTYDNNLFSKFDKVTIGMSKQQVVKMLGNPKIVNHECKWEFVSKQVDGCNEIYIYSSIWAPLNPEYPVIWFDKNNYVIDKFDFQSP